MGRKQAVIGNGGSGLGGVGKESNGFVVWYMGNELGGTGYGGNGLDGTGQGGK